MAHIHQLIGFTIAAYIIHENKVLLINHKELNMWLPIGGHIELDEDPEQALFREISEETGLTETDLIILSDKPNFHSPTQKFLYTPNLLDIHKINDKHKHIGITYFVKSHTDKMKLNIKEHNAIQWFTKENLYDDKLNIKKHIIYIAEKALDFK